MGAQVLFVTPERNEGKAVDVFYLNFSKTFDTVSHRLLRRKLAACGLTGVHFFG